MSIDFSVLPITPDAVRAARNYFGLNQTQAAKESGLPAHKIKRFEAGNYIPDYQFLNDLREFYEGRGYEFPDTEKPGSKAKQEGTVFPAGVVQSNDEDSTLVGKPQKSTLHHIRINPSLSDDEIGNILDHIEQNEERVNRILQTDVKRALFGGLSESAEACHAKAVRLLAENGTLLAKLLGRQLVAHPSESLANGSEKPQTHADLLAHTQAHMHCAVSGDKEAAAKHRDKAINWPQTLSEAVFG